MLKDFFDYAYYRLATFYIKSGRPINHERVYGAILATLMMNAYSFVALLFRFLQAELKPITFYIISILSVLLLFRFVFFVSDETKEKMIQESKAKYENDKHLVLKGIVILLYLIGTLVLFLYALFSSRVE
jgi:hypothetical protein